MFNDLLTHFMGAVWLLAYVASFVDFKINSSEGYDAEVLYVTNKLRKKMGVFVIEDHVLVVKLCNPVGGCQRFGGTSSVHFPLEAGRVLFLNEIPTRRHNPEDNYVNPHCHETRGSRYRAWLRQPVYHVAQWFPNFK
jgi:hypothetical protein